MVRSETTTFSKESDQQEVQDYSEGTKRLYDCTFCKRGFTNARALGGHMNIHRKERTKAKQRMPNSSLVTQVSSQSSSYFCILESPRNYNMCLQPSATNPTYHPPAYTFQYDFLNTRSQSLIRNQDVLSTNLSLQIGSSHVATDQARRGIERDGEGVDLELRLGHHLYSDY